MKSATGCFLVLGALPLILYPFVLLANIMGLAAQRSDNESLVLVLISYAFYIGTLAYPIVYLLGAGLAIVGARKKSKLAMGFAFSPIGYLLLLVGLAVIWALAEKGTSTLQALAEQGSAARITQCAPAGLLDGGDGLRTTGCGVLVVGGTSTAVIGNTLEAHNWELKVASDPLFYNRLTITLKNDGKACPGIRILDSGGRPANGFEPQKGAPLCPEGLITTSFFYFTPSSNGTYILRVFTPKTPGTYWLKIEQK